MFLTCRSQRADAIHFLIGQRVRQYQFDASKQVAAFIGVTQVGHAFAAYAETTVGIGAGWDCQRLAAVPGQGCGLRLLQWQ
jgi:hypothetical protein